jgi:hypothetical protein
MVWQVEFDGEFALESLELPDDVQEELASKVALLKLLGPRLSRPHADTLNGSTYANMKELRFLANDGVWRVAFAFDPERKAILLVAGDKSGSSEKRFYKRLIEIADRRWKKHLEQLKQEKLNDN